MNQPQKKTRTQFLNGLDENRGVLGLEIPAFFSWRGEGVICHASF